MRVPIPCSSLLLSTGIKKSECLGIHLNHIDLDAPDGPQVFIRYASPANRYKERKLAIPDDWVPVYKEYLAQYQPVDQLFPWSPRRLEYLLEDIGEEAGLKKHLSFDMCRWTCGAQRLPIRRGPGQDPPEAGHLEDPVARDQPEAPPVE